MSGAARILFASAAEGNAEVMAEFLADQGYQPITALTLGALDDVIEAGTLDVALIDADGFAPEVWSRCENLQRTGVPFFVISQHGEAASKRGRQHNAVRVFEKPLGQDALVRTIEQLLEE